MEELGNLLQIDNLFTTLIAPPGWGKTRMLLELFESEIKKIVFISPLRALAEEFSSAVGKKAFVLRPKCERNKLLQAYQQSEFGVLVATPELVDRNLLDIIEEQKDILVVMDEFHLYYYWGHTFRPAMWEACTGLINSSNRVLALSATMGESILEQWKSDSLQIEQEQVVINLGNQTLKNHPHKINYYHAQLKGRLFLRLSLIHCVLNKEGNTTLFFVRLRHQVDYWVEYFSKRGARALGCKGGVVIDFIEELDMDNPPQIIIATTAISHGVNLPPISEVFIDYPTKNLDFWIQMVGRGGRRGESFSVYTLDSYLGGRYRRGSSLISTGIRGAYLAIRHYFDL
ncbi:MAG: DEAD/DEAH box helicase [Bacteriovoracaceae bacterium]|nr:DEAD/DEAH box helicase [Bacteriovoracaceae bacterium]